jgi:hypothetical protein
MHSLALEKWSFVVGIDTFCHVGGWLTAVDADSGRWWRANETGEMREGWLASAVSVAAAAGQSGKPSATS